MSIAEHDISFFAARQALMLHNGDYYDYLIAKIRQSRQRIWATQFVFDVRPQADPDRLVRALCYTLAEAAWRGIDVRILLSRFVSGAPPLDINLVAARFLAARGVAVRSYRPEQNSPRELVHSKIALVDSGLAIIGSHNWTIGAFTANDETSVAVDSPDLTLRLEQSFRRLWEGGETSHEPA